jgi:molybdopterin-guanine dinucleotide biosynthesis protein B
VGAIKSDAHGVELDTPGTDTHRMRKGGAETTALVSSGQLAVFRDGARHEVPLSKLIEVFFSDLDFVLLEGFRSHTYPTIVVRRAGVDMEGWREPANVVAIASDVELEEGATVLALDDTEGIADLVCGLRAGAAHSSV